MRLIDTLSSCAIGSLLALRSLAAQESVATSDVTKYPASLKPIAASLVATQSIDQFENASKQLKDEVDQLAKK